MDISLTNFLRKNKFKMFNYSTNHGLIISRTEMIRNALDNSSFVYVSY